MSFRTLSACIHSPLILSPNNLTLFLTQDQNCYLLALTLYPGEKEMLAELRVGLEVPTAFFSHSTTRLGEQGGGWEARKPHNRGPVIFQAQIYSLLPE